MDFLNYYNHERPHAALGGRPPISRTSGSDYSVTFDQLPEPLDTAPQQLVFEDLVEPTATDSAPSTTGVWAAKPKPGEPSKEQECRRQ